MTPARHPILNRVLMALVAILLISGLVGVVFRACERNNSSTATHRGIYHWKTTYNPTEWEQQWMKRHRVDRLYVKLFEVDAGSKHGFDGWRMVPVATTRFAQPLPKDVEVVPVVYITVDAIRTIGEYDWDARVRYAGLLVERIYAMMAEHYGGEVREVQLDCDWTKSTRDGFFRFCDDVRYQLNKHNAVLGGTVRLHQLGDKDIPFDRPLLMCYNTGRLQDHATHNSILDHNDVAPYLRHLSDSALAGYDIAWPAYGWGVQFHGDGSFSCLTAPAKDDSTRLEWGEPREVRRVKRMLPPMQKHTVVLYHLDEQMLKHYTDEEIEDMYGPRAAAR